MSEATLTDIHPIRLTTWAEVDLSAIRHNLKEIRKIAGAHNEVLTVVKGDAYGHGMIRVAQALDLWGVGFFAVSDMEEGKLLRKNGITKPILLFESNFAQQIQDILDYQLTPSVCTLPMARTLNRFGALQGNRVDVQIEVDTGMGRLGVLYDEAVDFIKRVSMLKNISIKGIFTHFPMADTDLDFTRQQVEKLNQVVRDLDKKGVVVPFIHAANSMGVVGLETNVLNVVRPGLMLYGLPPLERKMKGLNLKPALSVKSKIIFIKDVKVGQGISYGHTFVARHPMKIATVAIGYKDGYLRSLSNKSFVLIGGLRCPVIGRVTMDQIMVDVSSLKNVRVGQTVVILGKQSKIEITAYELAHQAGTISYEIVCALGNSLPRVYT